mmetsp:Transcript_13333/g.52163  ORF Transcript_13333/g.52163 Transcript_13333/m.52163 type:complete len:272 (-) Transcript_13333:404-1219(-)
MSPTRSGTSIVISVALASLSWMSLNPALECVDPPTLVRSCHSTVASFSSSIWVMPRPELPRTSRLGGERAAGSATPGSIPASSSSILALYASPVPCRSTFSTSGGEGTISNAARRRSSAVTSASLMPLAFIWESDLTSICRGAPLARAPFALVPFLSCAPGLSSARLMTSGASPPPPVKCDSPREVKKWLPPCVEGSLDPALDDDKDVPGVVLLLRWMRLDFKMTSRISSANCRGFCIFRPSACCTRKMSEAMLSCAVVDTSASMMLYLFR